MLRVADVTPGMRRVTLGGPGLAAHTAPSGHHVLPFRSDGFDDKFKLFLRHPEAEHALVPEQLDGVLDWPRHPHLVSRTYTVRRWDPQAGELDVDLVIHGDGPATQWARTVRPGECIQVAGPKMSGEQPEADWLLIAADETGLPAVGRWLEELPEGTRAQVFVEVAEDSHRQSLPLPQGWSSPGWSGTGRRQGRRPCSQMPCAPPSGGPARPSRGSPARRGPSRRSAAGSAATRGCPRTPSTSRGTGRSRPPHLPAQQARPPTRSPHRHGRRSTSTSSGTSSPPSPCGSR